MKGQFHGADPLRGAHRDVVRYARELQRRGFVLERTRHNHVVVRTTDGLHVTTLGINRLDRIALARSQRQIERALATAA